MVLSNIFVYKIVLDIRIVFHCRKGLWTFVVIKELLMKKKNSWKIKSLRCSMIKLYFNFFSLKIFSLWCERWSDFFPIFSIYPLFVNKYCVMVVDGNISLSCWGKSRDIVGNALTSILPWKLPSLSFALYLGPSILLCRFTLRGNSLPSEEKQISISILMEKFVFWRMRI